jgi:hypothetical protein
MRNPIANVLFSTVLVVMSSSAFAAEAGKNANAAVVKEDRARIKADRQKLQVDKQARNAAAVQQDKVQLQADMQKLMADGGGKANRRSKNKNKRAA